MSLRPECEFSAGRGTRLVRGYVLERCEFNRMRARLPRAVRRGVRAVPEGHVGLVAQAIAGDESGVPLSVMYDIVPAPQAVEGLRALERRLTELLA